MTRARPTVKRRTFAKDEQLAQWRAELGEWGWVLKLGRGGYWYAEDPTGLVTLTDSNPKRTYHLAMGYLAAINGQPEEADIHQAERLATKEGSDNA